MIEVLAQAPEQLAGITGDLKSIKIGKRTLFREQDIQEYLNNCEFGEYICNQEEVA